MGRIYTAPEIQEYVQNVVVPHAEGKYTPDQVKEYTQHLMETVGPMSPGGSPDTAQSTDLFSDSSSPDRERMGQSFIGDAATIRRLKSLGYEDATRNAAGDIVAKKNGQWFTDNSGLKEHPINWMEAHMGKSLPTLGMMIGGALATPESFGLATAGGAGLGSAAGEMMRRGAGRMMGLENDGDNIAPDVAQEAIAGGMGAMGGQAMGRLPVPIPMLVGKRIQMMSVPADQALGEGLSQYMDLGKRAIAKGANIVTTGGLSEDAAGRIMSNPGAVAEAGNMTPSELADMARTSMEGRQQVLGRGVENARDKGVSTRGGELVPTNVPIQKLDDLIAKNGVNTSNQGPLSPAEISALQAYRKSMQTDVMASPLEFDRNEITGARKAIPAPNQEYVSDTLNKKPLWELLKTTDDLGHEVSSGFDKDAVTKRSDRYTDVAKALRGSLMENPQSGLNVIDPDLGAANSAYHDFKVDAKPLSNLRSIDGRIGKVKRMLGPNGEDLLESARKTTSPEVYDTLKNAQSAWQMGDHPFEGGSGWMRALALGGEMGAHLPHTEELMGLTALNDPWVMGQVLKGAGYLGRGAGSALSALPPTTPWSLLGKSLLNRNN